MLMGVSPDSKLNFKTGASEKFRQARRLQTFEQILEWPVLLNTPLIHKNDLVRDLQGKAHLVGHQQHGPSSARASLALYSLSSLLSADWAMPTAEAEAARRKNTAQTMKVSAA